MGQYLLVIFIIEVVGLIILERILFGSYLTPITVLSVPYIVVVILSITIGRDLGFSGFYYPSLLVWMFGLPLFSFPGLIFATVFLQKTNMYHYPYEVRCSVKQEKVIVRFTYLVATLLIIGFLKAYSISSIGSDYFQTFLGGGIWGHLLLISRFLFIYIVVVFKRRYLPVISILFLIYIGYGVKGWIFIPLISGILIRILIKKTNLSLFLFLKLAFVAIFIFFVVYKISLGSGMSFSFLLNHFMRYLFSGVLGLSEYIKQGGEVGLDSPVVVNPLLNIYNTFFGNGELYHYKNILTNIGDGAYTNTKTFFGTIYIYGGAIWGSFFIVIFGTIIYSFLIFALKTRNMALYIAYGVFLTLLFFGWFDTYSGNLFFYEFPVFCILFFLILPFLEQFSLVKNVKLKFL